MFAFQIVTSTNMLSLPDPNRGVPSEEALGADEADRGQPHGRRPHRHRGPSEAAVSICKDARSL